MTELSPTASRLHRLRLLGARALRGGVRLPAVGEHSAAPPSAFRRSFNSDGEGGAAERQNSRNFPSWPSILLHPPSTFRRCFNRNGEGASAERQNSRNFPLWAVILLHSPLHLAGVSIAMERGRQRNDRNLATSCCERAFCCTPLYIQQVFQ